MQNYTKSNLVNPIKKLSNFDWSIWLPTKWSSLTWWHLILTPLSWFFYATVTIRKKLYQLGFLKSFALPVPVVTIGNINVGGTGKTPLVIYLARQLRQLGFTPGIISRGYGGKSKSVLPVFDYSQADEVGDEPLLLAKRTRCPVYVSQDRVAAGQALLAANPECDIVISDDGLQHYRLQRDMEIAVVDGSVGFGNGALLPAGPLRELIARLDSVDAVVLNGLWKGNQLLADLTATSIYEMELKSGAFYNLKDSTQRCNAAEFDHKKIIAVAGIGNPKRFFQQLDLLELNFQSRSFPDHYAFKESDFLNMKTDIIIMTEKDAVKCQSFAQSNFWVLPVKAVLDDDFMQMIVGKLDSSIN